MERLGVKGVRTPLSYRHSYVFPDPCVIRKVFTSHERESGKTFLLPDGQDLFTMSSRTVVNGESHWTVKQGSIFFFSHPQGTDLHCPSVFKEWEPQPWVGSSSPLGLGSSDYGRQGPTLP